MQQRDTRYHRRGDSLSCLVFEMNLMSLSTNLPSLLLPYLLSSLLESSLLLSLPFSVSLLESIECAFLIVNLATCPLSSTTYMETMSHSSNVSSTCIVTVHLVLLRYACSQGQQRASRQHTRRTEGLLYAFYPCYALIVYHRGCVIPCRLQTRTVPSQS